MSWDVAGDVRFDWSGSLRVARRLWALADEVESTMSSRFGKAQEAAVDWLGAYGQEFALRVDNEVTGAGHVAGGLREGAQAWAFQWKSAMDEQNRILHAREEERVKADRSWADRHIWSLNGHEDLPPKPADAAVPQPPGFAPTRGFAKF